MLTNQELFDNAALGIIGQGKKACRRIVPAYNGLKQKLGGCLALSEDGKSRCALGWSVTDAEPGDAASMQWHKLNNGFGAALRRLHDEVLTDSFKKWQKAMSELALKHGLDDSCLYFKLVK